jgi:hypothetical protein
VAGTSPRFSESAIARVESPRALALDLPFLDAATSRQVVYEVERVILVWTFTLLSVLASPPAPLAALDSVDGSRVEALQAVRAAPVASRFAAIVT